MNVGVLRFLVRFVVIRLTGLVGMGFLTELFPIMGIDRVCKVFQFSEGRRFAYLAYDVLDVLH